MLPTGSFRSINTVLSIPNAVAVDSLNPVGPATMTVAAPPVAISWASRRPVGPAPITRALAPGRTARVSKPCIAQAAGSVNTAVSSGKPSTENTKPSGTQAYSAKNPAMFAPSPCAFSQRISRPDRQYWHDPQ